MDGEELIKRDLKTIEEEIIFYKNTIGESIIEIGKRLIEAREQLGEGESFSRWLKERVNFSRSTAYNFIRVSNEFDIQTVQTLGQSKVFELLTLSKEERNNFIKVGHKINNTYKTVKEMSVRELKKVIKEEVKNPKKENPKTYIKQDNKKDNSKTIYRDLLQKERAVESEINLLKTKKRNIEKEKLRAAKDLEIEVVFKENVPDDLSILCDKTTINIYIKRDNIEEFIYEVDWYYLDSNQNIEEHIKKRPYEIQNKVTNNEWDKIYTELLDYIPTYKLHCKERNARSKSEFYEKTINEIKIHKISKEECELKKELINAGYKSLAKKYHPDVGGDNKKFVLLNKVKKSLLN